MAISADTVEESQELAAKIGVGYHLLSDADVAVASAYGVAMDGDDIAIPAVFVIDRAGRIAWRKIGETMTDRPTLERVLDRLDALPDQP